EWAPDSRGFVYLTTPTTLIRDERRTAYIVDASTGATDKRAAGPSQDIQGTPEWSPDGKTLAFSSLKQTHAPMGDSIPNREVSTAQLILWDVATKRGRDASAGFDNSPGQATWSPDSKTIYFTA